MAAPGYSNVSIPEALFREVKRFVDAHPEFGFRSATDFATDALRTHLMTWKTALTQTDAKPRSILDRRLEGLKRRETRAGSQD